MTTPFSRFFSGLAFKSTRSLPLILKTANTKETGHKAPALMLLVLLGLALGLMMMGWKPETRLAVTRAHWPSRTLTAGDHWNTVARAHWPSRTLTAGDHWNTVARAHWPSRTLIAGDHWNTVARAHWPSRTLTAGNHWNTVAHAHWPASVNIRTVNA